MNRRRFLHRLTAGGALAALCMGRGPGGGTLRGSEAASASQDAAENRGSKPLRITRVRAILTQPQGARTCVVKVETNEPGLYGVGCATFTQRIRTVETAVNRYLDPFLRGKDPAHIEDVWQAMYQSSYWRNGPVLMNALGGVDMALWDIKGKRVGLPVYQLLGGKCRVACPVYGHAGGGTPEEAAESIQRFLDRGYRYVRCQVSVPGQTAYGRRGRSGTRQGHFAGNTFYPAAYQRAVPPIFEGVRKILGDEVELLHDVHERLHPIQAIQLAKDLEPYRLFFLEDPFAPEDIGYFKHLRTQTSTPIAMGELFNNPNEFVEIIAGRLIDFIRCHLSQIGGISPARKLANLCEFFRVRTAWHGPGDTSPVGHAANCHVDLVTWNFGIQEATEFNERSREVFPGTPEVRDGMFHVNEAPGLGVDVDEKLAAKYPIRDDPPFDLHWGQLRDVDGTIRRP
ncbi:MAG: starvation-sensing protein RspA [Planctomycetota bacterium]|nr:starvation-sensing protein RspA [Planctomycetota bacterium]